MDTLEIVTNREKELQPLYERMDGDAKKVLLTPYKMMRLDNPEVPVDHIVNVTMNFPGTYIDDLATLIQVATMQTVIEGFKNNRDLNSKEATVIENCLNNHFEMIDDMLVKQGVGTLKGWLARHINVRGWVGARYVAWLDKGEYVPDLAPWDMRYVAHEHDRKGLTWASCRTWRSPSKLKKEYPDANIKGTDDIEVLTYIDGEYEEVWIDKIQISKEKHSLGYVPVIIQACPVGHKLRDKGYMKNEGESALYLDRGLYDELNRSVSIEQTMAMKTILPAYVHEVHDKSGEPQPYLDKVAANNEVNPGEMPELLQVPDLNKGALMGRQDIQQALQQGGRNIDLGNISQAFSAVAISAIEEIRKKALLPRFDGIDMFYRQLSEMVLDQYKGIVKDYRYKEPIGIKGKQKTYTAEQLAGDYTIRFKFMSKSKEMEIANIAIAKAAEGVLPLEVRVRDILQAENPEEILAKLDSEKAEAADPVITLTRLAHSLIDEAQELAEEEKDAKLIESMMLTERAVALIIARKNPMTPPAEPTQQKAGGNNLLLPMLGGKAMAAKPAQGVNNE